MAKTLGKLLKVFIETDAGVVMEATGMVKNLSISTNSVETTEWGDHYRSYLPVSVETRLELNLTSPVSMHSALDLRERMAQAEWKCDYCGMINPRKATYCGEGKSAGCGAPRSFIYG